MAETVLLRGTQGQFTEVYASTGFGKAALHIQGPLDGASIRVRGTLDASDAPTTPILLSRTTQAGVTHFELIFDEPTMYYLALWPDVRYRATSIRRGANYDATVTLEDGS